MSAGRPAGAAGHERGTMGRTWRGPSPVCDARAVRPTLFEFAGGEPAFLALAIPRWSWDGLQAGAPSP